ncbi:MAG: penicillin acylase family protein, partial [Flavisolibacter sp.]
MRLLLLFVFIPLFSFSQFSPAEIARYKAQAQKVTIVRDNWGVPHIYGKTDADAVFGLLYVQCESNFSQVEENNLEMLGRLSEKYGKQFLYSDLEMRLIYDSAAAIADYKNSPAWLKKLMDAAADGVNYYLYKHPGVKPAVLKKFEPWFALMRTDGSISATQTGGLTERNLQDAYPINGNEISYAKPVSLFYENEPTGSNGLALAPSRTASKNAILYINPHTSFYFRMEVQLVSEEGLNTYGAVTWGTFFVYQGFNERCGWMHTSSYADVADVFTEKTEKKGGQLFYWYDKKQMPVKTKDIVISYKHDDGNGQQLFRTYSTIHGPVMGVDKARQFLSLKENNRSLDALIQSWLRTKAKGFDDFKKLMDMRVNNSNNTVFADDKGNIAYWHGNFMPRRNPKYDYSMPVDGSTSETDWKGLHTLDEMIHVYNPSSGWIENCNSTPFTASGKSSPDKEKYPVYMAPDGQNYRALNAVHLLEDAKGITIDRMIKEIGYNHYLSAFEVLLPSLFKAYETLTASDRLKSKLLEPIDSLKHWDMNAASSSVATTIAIEWAYRMGSKAS